MRASVRIAARRIYYRRAPLQCGSRGPRTRFAHRRTVSRVQTAGGGALPREIPARIFLLWIPLFFAGFLLAHAWFSLRGFRGDETFLPTILLLTGIGLILMISLRDPVRDTLLFVDFAQGVFGRLRAIGGCGTLDYERLFAT